MADKKITDLVDGGAPQATDEFVIARAGDNFKVDWASIDQELLDQAVILAPASSTRNVIVPTGDFIALAFEGSATRTEPMIKFTDLITGLAPPYVFELIDANGNQLANFYSEKYFTTTDRAGIYGTAAFTTAGVQLGSGSLSGQGFLDLGVDVSHTPYPIYAYDFDTGETIFFITAAGNPVFGGAAATPNSDLAAGDWSAYLDPTNGAAKMLFKAKTLDGTVVTWTIPSGTVYVIGGTDVAVADGGTGASTAAAARTNLGLAIGTDVAAASIPSQNGQAGIIVPTARGWGVAGSGWTANRIVMSRFVPSADFTVTSMKFRQTTGGTGNIDAGIYDATGARLRSSGSTAGKKGANTTQTVNLSSTLALTAGTVYYACLETDTSDGQFACVNFANATEQLFGTTIGLSESMFKDSTFPLPVSFVTPTTSGAIGPVVALI